MDPLAVLAYGAEQALFLTGTGTGTGMSDVPETSKSFLLAVFGADFWYVCHWHNTRENLLDSAERNMKNLTDYFKLGINYKHKQDCIN